MTEGHGSNAPAEQPLAEITEKRKHERTPLSLHGRFWTDDHGEHACLLMDISPGGARVMAKETPADESPVTLMINSLGRIEGNVVRSAEGEFSVKFRELGNTRKKLAASIAWQFNKNRLGMADRRQSERFAGRGEDRILLPDGNSVTANIVDVSLDGVSFQCDAPPDEGVRVRVGDLTGTVVRRHDSSFAVAFDPPESDLGAPAAA